MYEIVECPKCKKKSKVEFNEAWTGEDEIEYWWTERVI